jgi:hypothetical protein
MSMLASAQVVSAVVGRINGHTAAGANVAADRFWPWAESDLPAWRVGTVSEDVTETWLDGSTVEVDVNVDAIASVKALTGLQQAMDAIAAQALPFIFTAPVPYGLQLLGISREEQTGGESTLGDITVHLRAHIAFNVTAPETLISTP